MKGKRGKDNQGRTVALVDLERAGGLAEERAMSRGGSATKEGSWSRREENNGKHLKMKAPAKLYFLTSNSMTGIFRVKAPGSEKSS